MALAFMCVWAAHMPVIFSKKKKICTINWGSIPGQLRWMFKKVKVD